jgi:hypothetical protein
VIEPVLLAVLAFTAPGDFLAPATIGGGNGQRFTGSPVARWDCGVCHDRTPDLNLAVRSTPDGLFTKGYEPGKTYQLELTLSDEAPPNSAFSLEILSRSSAVAGTLANIATPDLCPTKFEVIEIQGAGASAQSVACRGGLNAWTLEWTAPATDIGAATLYVGAVAGNVSGDNTGDRATAQVLGIPSPSTVAQRSSGCGAPAAVLLIPFAVVLVRRRRAAGMLLLLVLLPALADAKPKAKPKKVAPPVTAPAPAPVTPAAEEPEPVAAPKVEPSAPVAAPIVAAPVAVPDEQAVLAEPEEELGPSVFADVATGFGFRALTQYSSSYAVPLRASFGYPMVQATIGFRPMRLLRVRALEGLELEGQYQRGWVVGPSSLGSASVLPADGRVSLGYAFELGPVTIDPRAVLRIQVGGVEKNYLFDDAWYQSVGGELAIAVRVSLLNVFVRPQVTRVLDTGTLAEESYGRGQGGLSYGGEAGAGVELGKSGFLLAATYRWTMTSVAWAGNGKRSLGPITAVDQAHQAAISLRYTR